MGLIIPLLLLGLMSSLSPVTLVVFILLLETTQGRANARAFLVGWAISLTLVFFLSYTFGLSHEVREGSGRTGLEVLKVLLGVALIIAGARRWSRRDLPRASAVVSPALADRVRALTPRGAAMVGIVKQPWAITASAAIVVLSHHTAPLVTVIAFATFTAVSTATVAVLFYYSTRRPDEAAQVISQLNDGLTRRTPEVFLGVSVTVGLVLILDGARALLAI